MKFFEDVIVTRGFLSVGGVLSEGGPSWSGALGLLMGLGAEGSDWFGLLQFVF